MKIVHCIFGFNTGGAETMLIDIINEQIKTDDVILIIVNNSYQQYLLNQLNERVRVFKINRKPGSRSVNKIISLNLLLIKLHPDVINVHNSPLLRLIIIPIKRIFLTVHALNLSLKFVNKRVTVIAISDAVKNDILRRKKCRVITIPNGIVTDKIIKKPINGINKKQFRIVQVGRLDSDIKGQDILIEAVAILNEKFFTKVFVDFIGEGESLQYLQTLVKEKHLMSQINFLGLQDRNYIYSHLKDYDLMCHPARSEGFGLTVAEAMAARLPVLVSNSGGPFEIICQGRFGTFFRTGDVADCANKIMEIITNYETSQAKAMGAERYVINNFSIQKMVEKYKRAYLGK